jgi:hypothetical protein
MSYFLILRDGRRLGRTCKQLHFASKSPQSGILVMDDILINRFQSVTSSFVRPSVLLTMEQRQWLNQLSRECYGRLQHFSSGSITATIREWLMLLPKSFPNLYHVQLCIKDPEKYHEDDDDNRELSLSDLFHNDVSKCSLKLKQQSADTQAMLITHLKTLTIPLLSFSGAIRDEHQLIYLPPTLTSLTIDGSRHIWSLPSSTSPEWCHMMTLTNLITINWIGIPLTYDHIVSMAQSMTKLVECRMNIIDIGWPLSVMASPLPFSSSLQTVKIDHVYLSRTDLSWVREVCIASWFVLPLRQLHLGSQPWDFLDPYSPILKSTRIAFTPKVGQSAMAIQSLYVATPPSITFCRMASLSLSLTSLSLSSPQLRHCNPIINLIHLTTLRTLRIGGPYECSRETLIALASLPLLTSLTFDHVSLCEQLKVHFPFDIPIGA